MSKLRVLYLVHHFPQISETYIRSEIEALTAECDIRVVSLNRADKEYRNHHPYQQLDDPEAIREVMDEFRPHVLHSHWLQQTRELGYFAGYFAEAARRGDTPFTLRAHSFDVLGDGGRQIRESAPLLNSDLCLGVLSFPFTRPLLEKGGIRGEKIVDCFPVVNFQRFFDPSPNGEAVMNVGACLPKKRMQDFLELAATVPGHDFNLYALGYRSREIDRLNARMGSPVNIIPPVEPEEMPREYKKHRWLVYTACPKLKTVGWPLAVAEAQAAGVGVCIANIRPDLKEYVGGAGFLYDSLAEVADIIAKPVPEEVRRLGFEQAKRSDVSRHKSLLLGLWRRAESWAPPGQARTRRDGAAAWGTGETTLEQRHRVRQAARELGELVPAGDAVLLVGDPGPWRGDEVVCGRRAIPFLERDGQYWGAPEDDTVAVRELERLRRAGANFMVFGWPDFWWLEQYPGLHRHLRSHFRCVLENRRLVVFDLRPGVGASKDEG
jgi:hypothetical protein